MRSSILVALVVIRMLGGFVLASGQTVLRGQVLDARVDMPLVGANVRVDGDGAMGLTDAKGYFELPCKGDRTTVRISYVGFHDLVKKVNASAPTGERSIFRLQAKVTELPELSVRSAGPEVVFERKDLHVGDYLVNEAGVWVLVYDQKQLWHRQEDAGNTVWLGARLHLLDTSFAEVASGPFPAEVVALERDYAGRPWILGKKTAWVAAMGERDIGLEPLGREVYDKAIHPWTDSLPRLLLGSTYDAELPEFDHVAFHTTTDEQEVLCHVVDPFMLELYRSEYKYMSGHNKVIAMDIALDTGVDPEMIAGMMTGFAQSIYFDPPYAPLFALGDTLCVFDHAKERIRRFDHHLRPVDEVPIVHHRDRHWDKRLFHDRSTNAVYGRFANGSLTWLQRVHPATGALGAVTRLTHPYPEDVQVFGGYVYYVYRPYGSLQKRTLYRERLR